MNEIEFDNMMSKLSPELLKDSMSTLNEKERKALSERALVWLKVAEAAAETDSPFFKSMMTFSQQFAQQLPKRQQVAVDTMKDVDSGKIRIPSESTRPEALPVARLAVLATGAFADAKKAGLPPVEESIAVLRDRKPKWFGKWLEFLCERQPARSYLMIRELEREGLALCERTSNYWLAMFVGVGQLEAPDLMKYLNDDPELFDSHMWPMLKDPAAMRALYDPSYVNNDRSAVGRGAIDGWNWQELTARSEQWRRASFVWQSVLVELVKKGKIERSLFIDWGFDWLTELTSDAPTKATINWQASSPFERIKFFFDELNLTAEEIDRKATGWLTLACGKDPATQTWAIGHLGKLSEGTLPLKDLSTSITRVFYQKRKEPALAALKLLDGFLDMQPLSSDERQIVLISLTHGFEHSSSEIQKKALSIFKNRKAIEEDSVAQSIREHSTGVPSLVLNEINKLLPGTSGNTQGPGSTAPADSAPPDLELARERINQIGEPARSTAGLQEALRCLEEGSLPGALDLFPETIPDLDPQKLIVPLNNLDDLIYLFLEVLAGNQELEAVERLLDGMTRLCGERPDDFEARVSQISKRVSDTFTENPQFRLEPFGGFSVTIDLLGIAREWINPRPQSKPPVLKPIMDLLGGMVADIAIPESGQMRFFSARAKAIASIIEKRKPAQLLSTPTHKQGFIDPMVLVSRMESWRMSGLRFEKSDFIQALLRLAFQNREKALAKLPSRNDEFQNALRWALGGPKEGSMSAPEIWVAAFRCREPRGFSRDLKERFPALGPDCATPAKYVLELENFSKQSGSVVNPFINKNINYGLVGSEPPFKPRPDSRFFPTELMHDLSVSWEGKDQLEGYWMQNREPYLGNLARRSAIYLESTGNYWKSSWEGLFDPDINMNEMGAWVIALGMTAKQQEAARLAVDLLIAAIEESRVSSTRFGAVMGQFFGTGRATLSRWINGLKEASRVSDAHLLFVQNALEQIVVSVPEDKPLPIPVLELLFECITQSQSALFLTEAIERIKTTGGKGKGAKLASYILNIKDTDRTRKSAAAQILENRIQRACRWQTVMDAPIDQAG